MTIDEARKVVGKDAEEMTDEQVRKEIDTAKFLTESMFDLFMQMSPEERLKFSKKI